MDSELSDAEFDKQLKERFATLPPVVQHAIESSDVEKHLRSLADTHKLHVDQWEALENEVMLALLGVQPVQDLAKNIKTEVGTSEDVGSSLASDISKIVFQPIREELERELDHPDAKAAVVTDVEQMSRNVLAEEHTPKDVPLPSNLPIAVKDIQPTPAMPATPPAPAPQMKADRPATSPSYKPAVASSTRRSVEGDPYREQLL